MTPKSLNALSVYHDERNGEQMAKTVTSNESLTVHHTSSFLGREAEDGFRAISGFTQWVAGGGFRSGMHGATDEFGHHAVEGIVNHYDYHATLLHLFGLDATQLTYEQNARDQSLLDGQPGKVIPELLA